MERAILVTCFIPRDDLLTATTATALAAVFAALTSAFLHRGTALFGRHCFKAGAPFGPLRFSLSALLRCHCCLTGFTLGLTLGPAFSPTGVAIWRRCRCGWSFCRGSLSARSQWDRQAASDHHQRTGNRGTDQG
jgi:hypothetical protein